MLLKAAIFLLHVLPFLSEATVARLDHPRVKDIVRRASPKASMTPKVSKTAPLSSSKHVTTYTIITPSPSAAPIAITSQSQVITTYIPQITLCAMSSIPVTPKYGNHSRTLSAGTKAPFSNSTSYSLSEGCLTHYSPLITTVCATILQGIATSINITACSQPVTFSSQYGYVLSIPPGNISTMTPSPVVQTQTTYWVAPWQALTAGLTPANVTERICSAVPSIGAGNIAVNETQCVDINEVWQTTIVTILTSTISHIDLTTTIPGPSQLMIETFHADITETMTELSLSTRMVLVYSTESMSTSISTVATASAVVTGPTMSRTMTLMNAPSHGHVTSTVKRLLTSTIYSGTTTRTVMSPVPSSSSVVPFFSKFVTG